MKIMSISNNYVDNSILDLKKRNDNYMQNAVQNVSFTGNPFKFLKDIFTKNDEFISEYSITENEDGYIGEVGTHFSKLQKCDKFKEACRLYLYLETPQERKLFKQHFAKYLPKEKSQQPIHTTTPQLKTNPAQQQNNEAVHQQNTNPKTEKITEDMLLKEFESLDKEDIPQLVSKVVKGSKDGQAVLLDTYVTLEKQHKQLLDKAPEKTELGRKLYVLEKQMKEQNVSFVPKPKFTCGEEDPEQFTKEKFNYVQTALVYTTFNEASAMDALSAFDKYGSRQLFGYKNCKSTLKELTISSVAAFEEFKNTPSADKILNKYLDVFAKFASRDKNDRDASDFGYVLRHCKYDLTKDAMIKLMNVLIPIAYEKNPVTELRVTICNHPDLLQNIKEVELPEIKEHLAVLQEITKDYPDLRPYHGDGSSIQQNPKGCQINK